MKAKKDFFNTTKLHRCALKVHSKYIRPKTTMWKDYSGVRKKRKEMDQTLYLSFTSDTEKDISIVDA